MNYKEPHAGTPLSEDPAKKASLTNEEYVRAWKTLYGKENKHTEDAKISPAPERATDSGKALMENVKKIGKHLHGRLGALLGQNEASADLPEAETVPEAPENAPRQQTLKEELLQNRQTYLYMLRITADYYRLAEAAHYTAQEVMRRWDSAVNAERCPKLRRAFVFYNSYVRTPEENLRLWVGFLAEHGLRCVSPNDANTVITRENRAFYSNGIYYRDGETAVILSCAWVLDGNVLIPGELEDPPKPEEAADTETEGDHK